MRRRRTAGAERHVGRRPLLDAAGRERERTPLNESRAAQARNAAAAAKLRQMKPQLQMLLAERFGPGELRIKLLGVV